MDDAAQKKQFEDLKKWLADITERTAAAMANGEDTRPLLEEWMRARAKILAVLGEAPEEN